MKLLLTGIKKIIIMKKITYILFSIFLLFTLLNCSSDSADSGGGEVAPTNPDGKGGSLATFALKGNYLYTVDYQSLKVFNIQNRENPVKVNQKQVGFNIETLFSMNDYLFIGSQNGMFIYDVSNPENPNFLSNSEHFTACDPVVANETHAFVTLHSNTGCGNNLNTLMVYDIDNPSNPVLIHQRNLTYPRGLALHENYLIVCDDELKIFDITNASEPILASSKPYNYKDVVIYNNILFAFGDNKISQFKWTGNDFLTLELISTVNY